MMKINPELLWNPNDIPKTYRNIRNAFRPGMIVVVGEKCSRYSYQHPTDDEKLYSLIQPGDTFVILKHFYVRKGRWRNGWTTSVFSNSGEFLEVVTFGLMNLDLNIIHQ